MYLICHDGLLPRSGTSASENLFLMNLLSIQRKIKLMIKGDRKCALNNVLKWSVKEHNMWRVEKTNQIVPTRKK